MNPGPEQIANLRKTLGHALADTQAQLEQFNSMLERRESLERRKTQLIGNIRENRQDLTAVEFELDAIPKEFQRMAVELQTPLLDLWAAANTTIDKGLEIACDLVIEKSREIDVALLPVLKSFIIGDLPSIGHIVAHQTQIGQAASTLSEGLKTCEADHPRQHAFFCIHPNNPSLGLKEASQKAVRKARRVIEQLERFEARPTASNTGR